MIVKNESSCLEKSLNSVEGADAIYISDTGSTDNTVEIAKRFTDKVYTDFTWNDSFADARNFILQKAETDWVLSIDADEYLETSIEDIRKEIEKAEASGFITINCKRISVIGNQVHKGPMVFKRVPEIYWQGDIHNHLSVLAQMESDIFIRYGYSEAHKQDPDRALRILTKLVTENPTKPREIYYLAREYWYRRDYATALSWYDKYLPLSRFLNEKADAYVMAARCAWNLHQGERARNYCLQAININANFKEALLLMAEMSYEKNAAQWRKMAETANNEGLLFVRTTTTPKEKDKNYYNQLFARSSDMSRYTEILKTIGELVKGQSVLDIGCGPAELQKYVLNYRGFDFSDEAVRIADNKGVWQGNAYDRENYEGQYDVMVTTEVLEHLDDLRVLENIPSGQKVIFSVPSFPCESHIRTFTEITMRNRYAEVLIIEDVIRFNLNKGKWEKDIPDTKDYILLVQAIKK